MIEIRLFGIGRVQTADGVLDRNDLGEVNHWRVLQLLAVHRTLGVSALAEMLWDGDVPAGHAAMLAGYVAALNERLGPVVLIHTAGYGLDESRVTVDLWTFDELLSLAQGRSAGGALPLLERALGLSGRLPFPAETGLRWAAAVRGRYRARVVATATDAARYALATGAVRRALDHAAFATDLDPAAEDAWRIRITAQHATGDRAGALQSFQACRQILADERGTDPTPATSTLFGNLLRERRGKRGGRNDRLARLRRVIAAR